MIKYLKLCGAAVIALSLTACADNSVDPNAFYGDLNAAEKTKYMDMLLTKANSVPQQEGSIKVHYTADVERGLIISNGTYPKPVSDEKLEMASAAIVKNELKNPTCYQPEVSVFVYHGLSVQAIMRDPNGKVLYESELCEGATFAPRPYQEQTEEQQAMSLTKLAKSFEARARSKNLNPNSIHVNSFKADSVNDVLYGTLSVTKKLSPNEIKKTRADFNGESNKLEVCKGEEIITLNENGIRFEYNILDINGNDIVPPWVCPATNTITLSAVPQLRGQTASR